MKFVSLSSYEQFIKILVITFCVCVVFFFVKQIKNNYLVIWGFVVMIFTVIKMFVQQLTKLAYNHIFPI